MDLGNGLTLETYWETINALREKQHRYNDNALLSTVDQLYNELLAEENLMGGRCLPGV